MQTVADMEVMVAQGCGVPGCGHNHDTLYMNQRCHPRAGLRLMHVAGQLRCLCFECGLAVVGISVPHLPDGVALEGEPRCHRAGGLDASYTKGTGNLVVACRKCERVIATLTVGLI